jgi:hypothetical protein
MRIKKTTTTTGVRSTHLTERQCLKLKINFSLTPTLSPRGPGKAKKGRILFFK